MTKMSAIVRGESGAIPVFKIITMQQRNCVTKSYRIFKIELKGVEEVQTPFRMDLIGSLLYQLQEKLEDLLRGVEALLC